MKQCELRTPCGTLRTARGTRVTSRPISGRVRMLVRILPVRSSQITKPPCFIVLLAESLQKVQGPTGPELTWLHPQAALWDMPIDNLVDLCDTQRAGKEIVKRPMFKSLQMTLCHCVACRHLTWKPRHACSLGTQVFYILDYRMLIRPVQFSYLFIA